MRTVSEHQKIVAELFHAPAPELVPLAAAAGRVLAAPCSAGVALPGFDNSAMDGYAVRAQDIAGATGAEPVRLPVAADIPAGRLDTPPLEPGTAHRIMTGAPMPEGADTVVQVEATDAGTTTVAIREARTPGVHVRYAGEDVQLNDRVLEAGTVLHAPQLGLLAALGVAEVSVFPALRVLVLSTGSELVEPGRPLRHGQIYESNATMITAAVNAAGARGEHLHFVADDVAALRDVLEPRLGDADLVLTSGGVSAGAYEVVKDALTGQGVEFVSVAMQPGKPQGAGHYRGVPVVTMPGNPVSSLVSFEVFVRPALRAAMGYPDARRPVITARTGAAMDAPAGKRQFRRGVLDRDAGTVVPIGPPGSHYLRWLAAANCLIDIDEQTTHVDAGTEVEVWPLD
jgi:molybdopterin molybdotransferase